MNATRHSVSVSVPATTANLGPGFDCLGLALELRNRFTFTASGWVSDPELVELTVGVRGEGARLLARDHDNLVWRAARTVFSLQGRYPAKVALQLDCAIPLGKGLGSSASAIVGGVWGAAALAGGELPDEQLLKLAVELEGHPDNVVPAALGGFTICAAEESSLLYQRVTLTPRLTAVVAVPAFSLRTSEARRRLPKQVPLADAVFNVAHATALVAALLREDWTAAGEVMADRLHQPYRAPLIPGFTDVCAAARAAGAFGAALSGAGPSVLALIEPAQATATPAAVANAMEQAFLAAGVTAHGLVLSPATEGVQVSVD